ncbi:hypothetical protein, partial [Campylobacter sp. 2018MI27]|uniref:YobI family P-loop NTPase n=1 Tax=Campylobacter sp. 2018MI27 TaxID=2836738 RepID=UPI0032F096CB|nr:hypothetical protein [Campylobacter sp. 2018MI27]
YSNFKRIQPQSNLKLSIFSVSLIVFLSCSFLLYKSSDFWDIFAFSNTNEFLVLFIDYAKNNILDLFLLSYSLCFLAFLVFKCFGYLNRFRICNISINFIEISANAKVPLLNNYSDLFIYYFYVTKYEIVVFEDLDRFENIEIFTRLKELNNILNNSEQISQKITFLYAVKDDMLSDTSERVKFFELIIPITPYLNGKNFAIEFKKLFKDIADEDFILRLSSYIKDMRALKNIFNEYIIFKKKLDLNDVNVRNNIELLALVVYKYLEPKDFSEFCHNSGEVYKVLNDKTIYKYLIEDELYRLEEKSKIDLRDIIIDILNECFEIIILDDSDSFFIDDMDYYINSLSHQVAVELLSKNYLVFKDKYSSYKLDLLEHKDFINSRIKAIELLNKELQKQIENLNYIKNNIVKYSFSELYKLASKKIKSELILKKINITFDCDDLMKRFLYLGFINEHSLSYITAYDMSRLGFQEKEFILNLKNKGDKNPNIFDICVDNNFVNCLSDEDFLSENILNYRIFAYYVERNNPSKLAKILAQLDKNYEYSVEFILCICNWMSLNFSNAKSINYLLYSDTKLWDLLDKLDDNDQESIINLVLENATENNLKQAFKDKKFQYYFENINHIVVRNLKNSKVIIDYIKNKKLIFKNITQIAASNTIMEYVIKNDLYKKNDTNINFLAKIGFPYESSKLQKISP